MLQSENSTLILNLLYQTFKVSTDFRSFSQTLNLGWQVPIHSELIFSSYQNYLDVIHTESMYLSTISPEPCNKNTDNGILLFQ